MEGDEVATWIRIRGDNVEISCHLAVPWKSKDRKMYPAIG